MTCVLGIDLCCLKVNKTVYICIYGISNSVIILLLPAFLLNGRFANTFPGQRVVEPLQDKPVEVGAPKINIIYSKFQRFMLSGQSLVFTSSIPSDLVNFHICMSYLYNVTFILFFKMFLCPNYILFHC